MNIDGAILFNEFLKHSTLYTGFIRKYGLNRSFQKWDKILNSIETFGSFWGLKLDRNKTEGIWLVNLKHYKDKFESNNHKDKVERLGMNFGLILLKKNVKY